MFTNLKDIASFPADEEAQERKGGGHRSVSFFLFSLRLTNNSYQLLTIRIFF